jgi:hypothetical protein
MYCTNCGAQLPDDAKFCTCCGTKIVSSQSSSQPQATVSPAYQTSPTESTVSGTMPMGWFKFLIYFSLWAGAVLNLYNGIATATGLAYASAGGDADLVYLYYGNGLKVLDIIIGISFIALAGFQIYTRFRLARFRKDGPTWLYAIYIAALVLSIIHNAGFTMITGFNAFSTDTISNIIGNIVMLVINYFYFKKRRHLFVN